MSFLQYKAIIYKDKVHRPLGNDERLTSDSIPVSELAGNAIRIVSDGLYVGGNAEQAYYVASTGTDTPTSGTKLLPFLTLDYAMAQAIARYGSTAPEANTFPGNAIIALKAGETFGITQSYNLLGNLTLTFYGDANYGDFNSPVLGPGARPAVMQDLNRPIITTTINPGTNFGINHFQAFNSNANTPVSLILSGVRVDLPAGAVQNSDYCDFFTVYYACCGRLVLDGAIINKLDNASSYGIFGMQGRARICVLEQYASQFWIGGAPVLAGAPPATLIARKWFIKFYPDFAGNNQSGGTLLGGVPGSAMMQLAWSDVTASPVLPGKTNLPSYPFVSDEATGLRNYFFNLTRDNQQRPLNVLSPYLLSLALCAISLATVASESLNLMLQA